MENSNFIAFMATLDKNKTHFGKSKQILEFLLSQQNNIYKEALEKTENRDADNNWDIEENFIQFYNEMYELFKRFLEIEYIEKPIKLKGKEEEIDLNKNVLFGDTSFISQNVILVYSKTFVLGLQELYKYIKIKPFDIFMIVIDVLSEEKLPNVNQKQLKVKSKSYEQTELKHLCLVLINELLLKFGFHDKKFLTLLPNLVTTIFKLLKSNKDIASSFTISALKLLKTCVELKSLSKDLSKKFLKYFQNILYEVSESDKNDSYLKVKGLAIDIYFVVLTDHKQMNDARLVEDILKKLGMLKFDSASSSQVANLIANSLLYYKSTEQLSTDNILEVYSRLITDNLDSRLGLVSAFQSMQIYLSYGFLKGHAQDTIPFLSFFIKPFIDMTIPYIEIKSVNEISNFTALFHQTIFNGIISKYMGKEEILLMLNSIITQSGFLVNDPEKLNFTLFYLDLVLRIVEFLRNDINDEVLIDKVETKLAALAANSELFQLRVTSNIVLKGFYKFVGNGRNNKIKKMIDDSYQFILKSLKLVDIHEFRFSRAHGHALIISNLSIIMMNENDFLLQVLVSMVNFLKNCSTNLIINGKISFYKALVSWIIITGILANNDPATKQVLALQRNQLLLLWNNLFLSSNFGVSIENDDELYRFLEIQYHSLSALLNFIRTFKLTELELKQLNKYLIKLSNIKYSIKSKIIDNLLLQIELRVLEIYNFLLNSYDIDFNNNTLLLLLIKNISSVAMFEDDNKNILQEFFNNDKNDSSKTNAISFEKFLSLNESHIYGLTSLVQKDMIKWEADEIVFKPWENDSFYWNYNLQLQIDNPFSENIFNDHLKILTSAESEVKSKKISTAIVDISIIIFTKVFHQLNPTIQLSILENLHSNLITKNLILDRLEVIHINALVTVHKLLKDSKTNFEVSVASFIKTILESLSVNLLDDYKIILLSESLAVINEHLEQPSINSDFVLTRLTSESKQDKYLSIMELSYSLNLNESSNDDNKEIYNLLAAICNERKDKKTLQWGLMSFNTLLTNPSEKVLNDFLATKIIATILSVLVQEDNTFGIYEIIEDIWSKFLKAVNNNYLVRADHLESALLITYTILNQGTPNSVSTVLKIVDLINKDDVKFLNEDLISLICRKNLTSYFYTVVSNTENSIDPIKNDLFELTSINRNFVHTILDYLCGNERFISKKNDIDYFVVFLLLQSSNDNLLIKKFKQFFQEPSKISTLLKVFKMSYNDLVSPVLSMRKSHLEFLTNKTGTDSKSWQSDKDLSFFSHGFSTCIRFKETLLETLILQIELKNKRNQSLHYEDVDSIIEICYDISLNYIKDINSCELSLKLLNLILSSINDFKLNNKQTSQINTIINLHYENEFATINSIKLLFNLLSTVISTELTANKEIKNILVNGLSLCTSSFKSNNEIVYISKLKLHFGTYSNLVTELKALILKAWAIFGNKYGLLEIEDYLNQLLPLWIIVIRDSLIRKVTDKALSEQILVIDADLILIIKTFILVVGDKSYTLPQELTNDDVLSLLYICYVSCISFMFTNIKFPEKVTESLHIIESLLFLDNDLNIFSRMHINDELHSEFMKLLSIIISNTSDNDTIISKVLENIYMKLPFEESSVDILYDYLSLNIQILQKYLPVMSHSNNDLYQQLNKTDYGLIESILLSISSFIELVDDVDMKTDLVACVLNYIGNVINKSENFNYYFPYVISSLQKLLPFNSDISLQFWKVVRTKIETGSNLLDDYYLQLLALFIRNVDDMSFDTDKFVNILSSSSTDKDTLSKVVVIFNQEEFQSKSIKNVVFKKCCRNLLLSLNGNSIDNVELLLIKFNMLFKNNLTPASHKLIFVFYSKVLLIKPEQKEFINKSLLSLFENDLDLLSETISDYSKAGEDYSNLIG